MRFSLRKDTFNIRNICYFFFLNNSFIFFMINVASDEYYSALKYLENIEVNPIKYFNYSWQF